MKRIPKMLTFGCLITVATLVFSTPTLAQNFQSPLTEETLREILVFADEANLKYATCEVKTYPTCTYVWGAPHSKDATRIQLGLKPEGNTLMTIFARAGSLTHFDRVEGSYTDAQTVDSVGARAIWSATRRQLSLISDGFLIIHVNIDDAANPNPKGTAIEIAEFLLSRE